MGKTHQIGVRELKLVARAALLELKPCGTDVTTQPWPLTSTTALNLRSGVIDEALSDEHRKMPLARSAVPASGGRGDTKQLPPTTSSEDVSMMACE